MNITAVNDNQIANPIIYSPFNLKNFVKTLSGNEISVFLEQHNLRELCLDYRSYEIGYILKDMKKNRLIGLIDVGGITNMNDHNMMSHEILILKLYEEVFASGLILPRCEINLEASLLSGVTYLGKRNDYRIQGLNSKPDVFNSDFKAQLPSDIFLRHSLELFNQDLK